MGYLISCTRVSSPYISGNYFSFLCNSFQLSPQGKQSENNCRSSQFRAQVQHVFEPKYSSLLQLLPACSMTDQTTAEAPDLGHVNSDSKEVQDKATASEYLRAEVGGQSRGVTDAGEHEIVTSGEAHVDERGPSSADTYIETSTSAHGDVSRQADNLTTTRPPRPPGSIRQARRDKRKAGWERKKALVKEAKREKRERREEAMRQAGVEIPSDGKLWRDLPPEQWSVSQRVRMAKKKEFENLVESGGYRVCVDMAFHELMPEKARASLIQQILYMYGTNRKATQPCQVTLTGVAPVMASAVRRLSGFDTWLAMKTESRCYTEVFKREDLVYLSADSPDTINQLEEDKVYIIGGLVDRNAHKGLCFRKATEQGIATAKLPLKKEDLNSRATKVMATNHVFDVLIQGMESGGNLQKVEPKSLPPRKRAGWTGGDNRIDIPNIPDQSTDGKSCVPGGSAENDTGQSSKDRAVVTDSENEQHNKAQIHADSQGREGLNGTSGAVLSECNASGGQDMSSCVVEGVAVENKVVPVVESPPVEDPVGNQSEEPRAAHLKA